MSDGLRILVPPGESSESRNLAPYGGRFGCDPPLSAGGDPHAGIGVVNLMARTVRDAS